MALSNDQSYSQNSHGEIQGHSKYCTESQYKNAQENSPERKYLTYCSQIFRNSK